MIHPEAGPEAFLPDMMSPGSTEDPEEPFCCVFCESGFEPLVVHALEYCGYGRALFPQRIKPVCRRGVWTDEKRALLPQCHSDKDDGKRTGTEMGSGLFFFVKKIAEKC